MSNIKSSLLPLTCIFISMLSRTTRATETPVAPSRSLLLLRNVRWSVKSPPVSCFRRFNSILLDNCVKECAARRQRCKAINYRRLYKVCDLCTETALISDIRSIAILMDDDLLKMASEEQCRDVTCAYTEKCQTNGITGGTICHIAECESEPFLAKIDAGRIASAPVNTTISCKSNACQQKGSSACDVLECRVDGTWSRTFPNKAAGKLASQISTAHDGYPERAVDGIRNTDYFGGSCSHTDIDLQPWWMVDLGSSECVSLVRIYNRQDCCSDRLRNLFVYVFEDPTSFTEAHLCAHYKGPASQGETINLECCPGRKGRYVRLQAYFRDSGDLGTEDNSLTLCEVEVY